MNTAQTQTLLETLDTIQAAIETSDRAGALLALSFARKILQSEAGTSAEIIIRAVIQLAAQYYGADPAELLKRGARMSRAHPRQLAHYLALQSGLDCETIGEHFQMDHSSISFSNTAVQARIDTNRAFRANVQQMLDDMPKSKTAKRPGRSRSACEAAPGQSNDASHLSGAALPLKSSSV